MTHYHTIMHQEGCGFDAPDVDTHETWEWTKRHIGNQIERSWDAEVEGVAHDANRRVARAQIDDRYLEPHTSVSFMPEPSGLGPYYGTSVVVPNPHRIGGAGDVYLAWTCEDSDCEHLAALQAAAD